MAAMTDIRTIALPTPCLLGGSEVAEVTLRKPLTRDLRGVHMAELLQMEGAALEAVLARCLTPAPAPEEIGSMPAENLIALGSALLVFFGPAAAGLKALTAEI